MNIEHPTHEQVRAYRRRLQNPYVAIEILENSHPRQLELEFVVGKSSSAGDLPKTKEKLSKSEFRSRARRVFRKYEPLADGKRRLRPEFRGFIRENEAKTAEVRMKIILELERYLIADGVTTYLNRERMDAVLAKLSRISAIQEM